MPRGSVLTLDEHMEERERVNRASRLVHLYCAVVMCICIVIGGGLLLPNINKQRVELELILEEAKFSDIPPSVTLPSPMLATFRGLMIHFMWPRAEELKQDGKYYELQQLSDWICNLLPRFPKAWEYAAWNMAYNISVGTYSARERWHWVLAGATLLRDRGLVYNPRTINLYKELSWIYLHKMGDFMDDQHWAYKRNWAVIMESVLGQPPPEVDTEIVVQHFEPIARAAEAMEQFGSASNPETLRLYISRDTQTPSMGDFTRRLAVLGLKPDAEFLAHIARFERRKRLQVEDLTHDPDQPQVDPDQVFRELMTAENLASSRDRLIAAVRAHVLVADMKLDPQYMFELMDKYGPLDWRNTYSHGFYWAMLGIRNCTGAIGMNVNVEMNTDRFQQFGLKDSFERGHLIFEPDFDDPFKSYIQLQPDYRFVDITHAMYLEHAGKHLEDEPEEEYFKEGPAGRLFKSGHVNFLQDAVKALYREGFVTKSQFYYDYLRENYKESSGEIKPMYLVPLEEFAMKDFFDDLSSFKRAPLILDSFLQSGFMFLAFDRPRAAVQRLNFARQGHAKFMSDKNIEPNERRKIPPWPEYVSGAFQRFVTAGRLPLFLRARAWRNIDNDVRLRVYFSAQDDMRQLCSDHEPPFDADKTFPVPEGFEDYQRRRLAQEGGQPDEDGEKHIQDTDVSEGTKR